MLVLSRPVETSVVLDGSGHIVVKVLGVTVDKRTRRAVVKLGIDAPSTVEIVRDELLDTPASTEP